MYEKFEMCLELVLAPRKRLNRAVSLSSSHDIAQFDSGVDRVTFRHFIELVDIVSTSVAIRVA